MRPTGLMFVVAVSLATGCAGCVAPQTPAASSGSSIPFTRIESGQQTHYETASKHLLMFDSDPEWQQFWRRHVGGDGREAPAVDFAARFVLGALLGERKTAGYGIQVTSVSSTDHGYAASYEEYGPGTCAVSAVITYPFDIVSVARKDDEVPSVEFRIEATKEQPCGVL